MKRPLFIILALVLLLALPAVAKAFDGAQQEDSLQAAPGGEARGVIYFYQVNGQRATWLRMFNVILEVIEVVELDDRGKAMGALDAWKVEFDPPLHESEVTSRDRTITVEENLHLEPTELSSEPIEDVPEGMVCLNVPGQGYILAKPATVIVRVPEGEEVGTRASIKMEAIGYPWMVNPSSTVIGQSRDFTFTVTVVAPVKDGGLFDCACNSEETTTSIKELVIGL